MLESLDALRKYPSGFFGSASVKDTQAIDTANNQAQQFNVSNVAAPTVYPANLEVSLIWSVVTGNLPEIKTFEFRERVLRAALKAFGTNNLYDWIQIQKQSDRYDEYHARWIDETLSFAFHGTPRSFSTNNWTALLDTVLPALTSKADSDVVKNVFSEGLRVGTSFTFKQFLQNWLSQKNGIDDLTNSLYVLYGPR